MDNTLFAPSTSGNVDDRIAHRPDLGTKAKLYGRAGHAVYWVVTKDVVFEHTEPTLTGYQTRTEYRPGDRIPVRYAETTLAVDDHVAAVMMSIIFHAYAFGDYANADIEIADLSAEGRDEPRNARIRRIGRNEIIGRAELTKEIEDVYTILRGLVSGKH